MNPYANESDVALFAKLNATLEAMRSDLDSKDFDLFWEVASRYQRVAVGQEFERLKKNGILGFYSA